MKLLSFFSRAPNIEKIKQFITKADERPSTETIESLKSDMIQLAEKVQKAFKKQDILASGVVRLKPLTNTIDQHMQDDWFVVGDIHSDFCSLCRILLKIYLRPGIDPNRIRIVFLGDYIDRGARPFEVLKLLFSLKVEWPEHFWLLRGNHELLHIGDDGIVRPTVSPADCIEFWKEHVGEEVFRALSAAFDAMPIAFLQPFSTVNQPMTISKNILYVHAGIPRTEYLHLPLEAVECGGGYLWSDPELQKADVLNGPAKRFSFGSKDFFEFCGHHDISLMIRGHDPRKDGIDLHEEIAGSGYRLITIFSCGTKDNEDSYYGSDILVPRFLYLLPNRQTELPLSVEEVYRDDIYVAGNLMQMAPELFQNLLTTFKNKLPSDTGIAFNVRIVNQDNNLSADKTDVFDTPSFFSKILLMKSPQTHQIKATLTICNITSSLNLDLQNIEADAALLVAEIQKIYPIFGRLPHDYFHQKENHHA